MSHYTAESIAALEASPYALASMADCAPPDSRGSKGAQFLVSVRDAVAEAAEYGEVTDDTMTEIADGAPDVYTATLWAEFVDLAAWREDVSDLGCTCSDLEQAARVALYMIAERLVRALVEEMEEADADA